MKSTDKIMTPKHTLKSLEQIKFNLIGRAGEIDPLAKMRQHPFLLVSAAAVSGVALALINSRATPTSADQKQSRVGPWVIRLVNPLAAAATAHVSNLLIEFLSQSASTPTTQTTEDGKVN